MSISRRDPSHLVTYLILRSTIERLFAEKGKLICSSTTLERKIKNALKHVFSVPATSFCRHVFIQRLRDMRREGADLFDPN